MEKKCHKWERKNNTGKRQTDKPINMNTEMQKHEKENKTKQKKKY